MKVSSMGTGYSVTASAGALATVASGDLSACEGLSTKSPSCDMISKQ